MSPVATDWAGQAARLCLCGIGRDAFPVPVGPSPTTAVRRCRSAGRSSAGRFCVLSLSRFTDSRSDRCPYCQSVRLRRDSAVRQDGSVSCQSVSEVGSGQFVHLRPLRFGVATRQWHISLPASLRLGRGAAIRQDSACCLSPTAETATTVRWFSDRSPDWQGPTWNLRCRADCHRRATRFSPCLGVRPTGDSTHRSLCLGLSTSLLSCLFPDRPVRSDRCRGLGVCPRGMFAQHRHQSRISRSDSLSSDSRVLPTVTFS